MRLSSLASRAGGWGAAALVFETPPNCLSHVIGFFFFLNASLIIQTGFTGPRQEKTQSCQKRQALHGAVRICQRCPATEANLLQEQKTALTASG